MREGHEGVNPENLNDPDVKLDKLFKVRSKIATAEESLRLLEHSKKYDPIVEHEMDRIRLELDELRLQEAELLKD